MKTYRLLISAAFLCASLSASAMHLGPIVIGTERTEEVVVCLETKTFDRWVQIDEEWAKKDPAGQNLAAFREAIVPVFEENRCSAGEITYTPKKVLRQWQGRYRIDGVIRPTTYSLVESTAQKRGGTTVTVYVITMDVPAQQNPSR